MNVKMTSAESGIVVYGELVQEKRLATKENGELIEYWLFRTKEDHLWECHSDYWELEYVIDEKIDKFLNPQQKQKGIISRILKWGWTK